MTDSGKLRQQIASFDFTSALLDGNWNNASRSPFRRTIHDRELLFSPIAEVGGVVAVEVTDPSSGDPAIFSPQARSLRKSVDIEVAKEIHQHILIFLDSDRSQAVWHFSKVTQGKRLHREYRQDKTTPLEPLAKVLRGMDVKYEWLDPTGELSHTTALDMMDQAGLYAEKVSKKFYNDLAKQRKVFEPFLEWIADEEKRAWYITALLNRLMFIYFLQHKGLLGGDPSYLLHRLQECKPTDCFYKDFFLPLCFFGFGKPEGQRGRFESMFKGVPYLNGGIFSVHPIEAENGITAEAVWEGKLPADELVPDSEFKRWFGFFDSWRWTLEEARKEYEGHINPDILGYIFEKYINQKQMGAYYTKEDITGYICRNTIVPRLFDMLAEAGDKGKKAVNPLPIGPHPNLLNDGKGISQGEGIDRYIYDAVKTTEYLPTETEREFDARQKRYESILQDFDDGKIATVNDFITYNLHIEQMAFDFASTIQDAQVLSDFYFKCLKKITVLDPTCGSGAFLFAALKILYPLYEACLARMNNLIAMEGQAKSDAGRTWDGRFGFVNEVSPQQAFLDHETVTDQVLEQFRQELREIGNHPHSYYIHKTIIVNNLFGVDIMEEAVEICKLRLFLKLIAHADIDEGKPNHGIEPLPDIDFNILAGNTLVGYTSFDDIDRTWAATGNLPWDKNLTELRIWVGQYKDELRMFRECLLGIRPEGVVTKQSLSQTHARAKAELDEDIWHLYRTTGKIKDKTPKRQFVVSHQPFHWFLEFPGVVEKGGFDTVIGNPPWGELSVIKKEYGLIGYGTETCGNLYAACAERVLGLRARAGQLSFIVQLPIVSSSRMDLIRKKLCMDSSLLHVATFDDRPGRLFEGLEHSRSAIFLSRRQEGRGTSSLYVTGYQRWLSEARPHLFSQIRYVSADLKGHTCSEFPKISDEIQRSILSRLASKSMPTIGAFLSPRPTASFVFYQEAMQYWAKATVGLPYYDKNGLVGAPAHGRYLYFVDERSAYTTCGLVNSSLFYLYFITYGDCFHLSDGLVTSFPIAKVAMADSKLQQLSRQLMVDLVAQAEKKRITTKTGDRITYAEFYASKSKPLIDEIDRALAKHYGFTDEELDFIINYDIKYRMGKDAENGEE